MLTESKKGHQLSQQNCPKSRAIFQMNASVLSPYNHEEGDTRKVTREYFCKYSIAL